MDKINFQDLPSTQTPIDATHMNLLQNNVETAINGVQTNLDNNIKEHGVVVSATEPQGNDRRKVWLRHENIFDNTKNQTYSNDTTLTAIATGYRAIATSSGSAGDSTRMACIDIGAISDFVGKKIIVKFKNNSSTNTGRIYIGKSNIGQTNRQVLADSQEVNNGSHIIVTGNIENDTSYPRLFIAIYANANSNSSVTANSYVDYTDLIISTTEDKTYILNNNNTYELFEPQNEIYSTNEVRIGTWIDGKPLYRKVVQDTTNSTTGEKNIVFANNVSEITKWHGDIIFTANSKIPLNYYVDSSNFSIAYNDIDSSSDNGRVRITTSQLSKPVIITLEYTKTTDA